jgi:hypothetical protein
VALRIIVCGIADEETHRSRLRTRRRGIALGERHWDAAEQRRAGWTPWSEPRLTLDGAEPVEANLVAALAFVTAPSN